MVGVNPGTWDEVRLRKKQNLHSFACLLWKQKSSILSTCFPTQTSSQQVKFVNFMNRLPLSQISPSPKWSCSYSISLSDSKLIHSTDILACLLDANHCINIYARSVFETQMNNIILDLKEFLSDRGDEKIIVICNKR